MTKYIEEQTYYITYSNGSYENTQWFIADSVEEAISMCRERNKGCCINEVRRAHKIYRKSSKTITVNV